jgi:hypothetical protein
MRPERGDVRPGSFFWERTMLTPAQRAALEATHARYCHFTQTERADCMFMAANAHPYANAYRALRAFFDTLRYASNRNARYFSFLDPRDCSQFWAPELHVTQAPRGFAGFVRVDPAHHEQWSRYLRAVAQAGWPSVTCPSLYQPGWVIFTTNAVLWAKLNQLACRQDGHMHLRITYADGHWQIELTPRSVHQAVVAHAAIAACIARYQGELPKRLAADDGADQVERPLAQKTFHYANVEVVTVTETAVLVPLASFGENGRIRAQDTANRLHALLEQGYPFEAVREWFQHFLTSSALSDLQRRYGAPSPATDQLHGTKRRPF